MWPDNRILDLFGIEVPIIQAPMAGSVLSDMVVAVSEAGGLGSLPCALLSPEQARQELETIPRKTARPINANFFCNRPPGDEPAREMGWRRRLEAYYIELGSIARLAFRAPAARPSTTKCVTSSWSFIRRSSASTSVFRTRTCWREFGGQGQKSFPRQLVSMRPAGLRIKGATRLSLGVMRQVGIGACFSPRMSLRRSARWRWCHRLLTR